MLNQFELREEEIAQFFPWIPALHHLHYLHFQDQSTQSSSRQIHTVPKYWNEMSTSWLHSKKREERQWRIGWERYFDVPNILKTAAAVSGKWHKGSSRRKSNLKKKPKIQCELSAAKIWRVIWSKKKGCFIVSQKELLTLCTGFVCGLEGHQALGLQRTCPRPECTNVTQNLKHRKSYKIIRCIREFQSSKELLRNPSRGYSDELISEYLLNILRRQTDSNET